MAVAYAKELEGAVGAGANQVTTYTLNVPAGKSIFLMGICASFTNAAGVGLFTMAAGSKTLRRVVSGAWDIDFKNPLVLPAGTQAVFTLAAGGTGQTGSISIWGAISDPLP